MAEIRELSRTLCRRAQEKHLTFATAESCTGGGLGAAITAIPGASSSFLGGITAYSNTLKMRLLHVLPSLLKQHGAVSPECACAMAEGVRRAAQADLAVSITGIAGPGGGLPEKPVGLVFLAIANQNGSHSYEFHFPGGRAAVRRAATIAALELLLAALP